MPPREKSRALWVPRRLCYALSGFALAGVLSCSAGPSAPDALTDLAGDPVVQLDASADTDLTVADLPGDVPAEPPGDVPADRPDAPPDMLADLGPDQPQLGYYCIPDGTADMAMCPRDEMFVPIDTAPDCPDGCRAVG